MTGEMKEAINKVSNKLLNMPKEEFIKEFKEHVAGDIAVILMEVCEGSLIPIKDIKGRRYKIEDIS